MRSTFLGNYACSQRLVPLDFFRFQLFVFLLERFLSRPDPESSVIADELKRNVIDLEGHDLVVARSLNRLGSTSRDFDRVAGTTTAARGPDRVNPGERSGFWRAPSNRDLTRAGRTTRKPLYGKSSPEYNQKKRAGVVQWRNGGFPSFL
jgi:hypothetical protein